MLSWTDLSSFKFYIIKIQRDYNEIKTAILNKISWIKIMQEKSQFLDNHQENMKKSI